MIKKISAIALSCVLLTTACSEVNKKSMDASNTAMKKAEEGLKKMRSEEKAKDVGSVRHSDRVWLGSRGYRQQNGDPLPNKYDNITYVSSKAQTLGEISSDLAAMTGMRFIVRDAENSAGGADSDASIDLSSGGAGSYAISYNGDFVGLLNQLSTKFDVFWEHRENVIYLSKYVTRTLALYSLPSVTELKAEITAESDSTESSGGSSGGGDSTESGTDNSVTMESKLNVWEEIEEVLESMLPEGSNYAMSPSTGTLTITSSPLAIRKVENLVKKQNEILSRQVVIDVSVMSIVTRDTEKFKVDLNSTLNNLGDDLDFNWKSPSGNLTELSGVGTFTGDYNKNGNNSASFLVDALSEKFINSTVTNSSITTLNNHAVPLQIITKRAYLREMETTVDEGVVSSSVTPGEVTTGFVMNVLPRVLANGNVMMQYSMSLSEMSNLETLTFGEDTNNDGTGDSSIQLPTVVSRDFLQNVKLKSGDTLVLSGYDRYLDTAENSGVPSPNNWVLGGGKYGSSIKEVLVLLITPRIIE